MKKEKMMLALLCILIITGCNDATQQPDSGKPNVPCSKCTSGR
ncbi:hypothetical protein [Paenibacillus terrae]|nr:hypothetical protein [Paenibacillus terrae]